MAKVYLSPSVQSHNIGVGDFGSEQYRMNLICDFAEVYLKAQGIETKRNNPNWKIANICGDSNAWRADRHIAIHSNDIKGRGTGNRCVLCRWVCRQQEIGTGDI
jgi:N-acetylmuramoyl-L-alanine amidase